MRWQKWRYASLATKDSDLEKEEAVHGLSGSHSHRARCESFFSVMGSQLWLGLVHFVLFISWILLIVRAALHKPCLENGSMPSDDSCPKFYVDDEQCIIHMSTVSPLIDAGVINLNWQTLDRRSNSTSIFRGPPSYDREKAWETLDSYGTFNLPAGYLKRLGKSDLPGKVKTPPAAGEGYAAYLEVHHQIHCLASLRRWSYKEEYVAQMGELPELFHAPISKVHEDLDSCIEMLRQSILCNADTTPVLLVADNSSPSGYVADLSTKHKCRDYDAIVAWEKSNAVLP